MSWRRLSSVAAVAAIAGLGLFPATGSALAQDVERFMERVFGPPESSTRRSGERPRPKRTEPKSAPTAETEREAPATARDLPPPVPRPAPGRPPEETAQASPTKPPVPQPSPIAPADGAASTAVPAEDGTAPTAGAQVPVPVERPEPPPVAAAPTKAVEQPTEAAGAETARPDNAPNATEILKTREPTIDPATAVVAAAAIEDAVACEAELKRRGARFTVGPSISEGECGVLRPVAFERSSSGVAVGPGTRMLCRTALALDIWMTDVVEPAAKAEFPDRELRELQQASTYVCRPRASETGISEHSRGSPVAIGAVRLAKGAEIGLAALPPGLDGVVVCLGDMPLVAGPLIDRLIAAFDPEEGRAIAMPTFRGKQGNPMLWSMEFLPEMMAITGDVGARHLVGKHADRVVEVEVADDAVLKDFDTADSLRKAPGFLTAG